MLAATWAEARDQTIWKAIIGCLLEVAVKIVMNNHFYSFNNTIRLQKKGGAIGSPLTETFCKLMGKRFTKKFGGLFKKYKNELELSRNYVYNFLEVLASLEPVVRFFKENVKMVRKQKWVDEDN